MSKNRGHRLCQARVVCDRAWDVCRVGGALLDTVQVLPKPASETVGRQGLVSTCFIPQVSGVKVSSSFHVLGCKVACQDVCTCSMYCMQRWLSPPLNCRFPLCRVTRPCKTKKNAQKKQSLLFVL